MAGRRKAPVGYLPWVSVLGLVLVTLKLTGIIDWPWAIVLAPLGLLLAVYTFLLILILSVVITVAILARMAREKP